MTVMMHQDHSAHAGRRSTSVLQSVRVEGRVSGLLFDLTVEQCYVNASDTNIEAVYTFPVPWKAVLLGVECVLGEKVLGATVVAKADAGRRYERALEEGDAAVMVERADDGAYTVNVGNLLPGEQAIVRFRYAQLLSFAQGQVRLVIPTVIAPRYGDPRALGLQPHQIPTTDLHADYPFALSITIHGDMAAATLSSPSHHVAMRHVDGSVILSLGADARLDRDFVLQAGALPGRSISTLGRDGDGYVALASFCPHDAGIPAHTPLNLKLLVDCSGSMNGDRISAARRAVHEVLSHLEEADNFSFSCFGSNIKHFSSSLMAATSRAIKKASEWVAETDADMGGTEIKQALQSTFALAQPFSADVLLITDGDVWEADALIASAQAAGQRVFAVGIGSAPASSLLQALASKTGGACEFVDAHTEVADAIMRMFKRMRQAPVRNVSVEWDGTPVWQTEPGRVVLSSETLHHFARFADRAPTHATLRWHETSGDSRHCAALTIDDAVVDGDTLARVAAATRMAAVSPAERHALALQYELISATTNLILVHQREDAAKPSDLPTLRTVAHALPVGWGSLGTHLAVPLAMPAVWRRESASAVVRVSQEIETYDIPAFLRKQVGPAGEYLYRDSLRRLVEEVAAMQTAATDTLPASLDAWAARLPAAVIDDLRGLVEAGFPESELMRVFIVALAEKFQSESMTKRVLKALRQLHHKATKVPQSELKRAVDALVARVYHARATDADIPAMPKWLARATD